MDIEQIPLNIVMDTVLDGLIVIDSLGNVKALNRSAQRIFGYDADEVVGQNVRMLMPQPYRAEHDGYLQNYKESGHKKVIGIGRRVQGLRKNGDVFTMDLGVNELPTASGICYLGLVRDVTDEVEAADKLISEKNLLDAVLSTVLDGVITIDDKGTVVQFNNAAERIFGYQRQEVLGSNVKMLMAEPYHSAHDGYLSNYMAGEDAKVIGIGREVEAKRKDGTIFPMELGVSEARVKGQRMFVGIIRDITERRNSEQKIHKYIEMLKLSNQELDDFAYIASHDLKEPLRGIANNALFLEEDYFEQLDDDGKRRLNRMKYLCGRLESLINDLLYYSRLGRQDLAFQSCDLNRVVDDIEQLMETTLTEEHAVIIRKTQLPTIICDATRVTELFRNLITNAVKYNDKPVKEITIGHEISRDNQIVYQVSDNGIGIDQIFFDDVFRIFKRLNNEDDKVRGTGVGLTFVKKIVERHRGKVWLSSEVGVGTTFFFTLDTKEHNDEQGNP